MKSLLIFISDIHYTGKKFENEGIVLNAFMSDIRKIIQNYVDVNIYLLIGGDLVYSADDASIYNKFEEEFIKPLITMGINRDRIICVPGNHDIQRSWINENKLIYTPMVDKQYGECDFNDLVENPNSVRFLTEKFDNFSNFIKEDISISNYNPILYNYELNDDWSIYCLNSSLTSYAGIDKKNDIKRLNLYTRKLYQLVSTNLKKKILLLHHPLEYLSEWCSSELMKIIKLNFDIVLTGHTHNQDILCNNNCGDSYIWCQAPQLYSDKNDKLGYCLIELEDIYLDKIIYREWFSSRNAFRAGLDFTESEDGIIRFEKKKNYNIDPTLTKIEEKFRHVMSVYGDQPPIWMDRFLSSERFDRSYRFEKNNLLDEQSLLDFEGNIKIITPAQYGLSSFAWHFIMKLWKERKEFCLYIDSGLIRKGSVDKIADAQLKEFGFEKNQVRRIIIDNWTITNKNAKQILTTITQQYPDIRIIILCPMLEKTMIETENISVSEFDFSIMFMAPLQTYQLRSMVEVYNKNKNIGQNDIVLKRLDADIQDFNMHRTPLNCITLLEVFSFSFDDNPVNRTSVIEKILTIIFESEDVPNYKSLPDVKDCEFALGFYCEKMIREESFYFSAKEFYSVLYDFCRTQKITIDIAYLFDLLLKNNIICQYDSDLYSFRFSYWVYYFAAMRMTKDSDFADFILSNENYLHYPEVIEFYTGSDRTRNDAAVIITNDIQNVSKSVHDKVGVPEGLNPFSLLKIEKSDEQIERAIQLLETNLQKSKLPNEIKDSISDRNYNPSRPFHQSVYKVFENYSVNYLQEIIGVASKTLRNSDYINPDNKVKLFSAITKAWFDTIRVIYLMVPALAYEGFANYDGFGLRLSESFNSYKDDPNRLIIAIIAAIPLNLMKWYKDNIYSAKLSQLIFDQIENEKNVVIKHLLICMIIHEQPSGWDDIVRRYLTDIDKNSYYFGNTLDTLKMMYANGIMSESNVARTKNLIMLSYTKLISKDNKLHPGDIKRINKDVLPNRKDLTE